MTPVKAIRVGVGLYKKHLCHNLHRRYLCLKEVMFSRQNFNDDRLYVTVARSQRRFINDVVDHHFRVDFVLQVDDRVLQFRGIASVVLAPAQMQNRPGGRVENLKNANLDSILCPHC